MFMSKRVLNCGDDIYRICGFLIGVGEIDKLIMRDVTIAVFRISIMEYIIAHHIHLSFDAYLNTPLSFSP